MLYKDNWDMTKQRLNALWEKEIIDRCCIAMTVRKDCSKQYLRPQGKDEVRKYYTDPEKILERYYNEFENSIFIGEALPSVFPVLGTAGHCAYFDCKYEFAEDTIWFFESMQNMQSELLEFNNNNEMLNAQRKIIDYIAPKAVDKFFIAMPDNCGNLDALAHIRGSSNLLIDMMEEPEEVEKALKKIREALIETAREFYEKAKDVNKAGTVHSWMNTWSKGIHLQMQCDISVMISEEMFEKFALPDLTETANQLQHSIYHLDGQEQIRHLDMLLSIKKLDMIQWTPVEGQPKTSSFIGVFKKIQRAGKGLVLFPEADEVELILQELSPKGLLLNLRGIKTKQEADYYLSLAEKHAISR